MTALVFLPFTFLLLKGDMIIGLKKIEETDNTCLQVLQQLRYSECLTGCIGEMLLFLLVVW